MVVQRLAGLGELQNCHPECNAPPIGGGRRWVENTQGVASIRMLMLEVHIGQHSQFQSYRLFSFHRIP
jgi:hypothetical protein